MQTNVFLQFFNKQKIDSLTFYLWASNRSWFIALLSKLTNLLHLLPDWYWETSQIEHYTFLSRILMADLLWHNCLHDLRISQERRQWCIHLSLGFKTYGQSRLKSKTEGANSPTKWWLVTAKRNLKKRKNITIHIHWHCIIGAFSFAWHIWQNNLGVIKYL